MKKIKPRILLLDIETSPILASVWSLWDQTIPLNMIEKDWHILAVAAKWHGEPKNKVMYIDQRNTKNIENDKKILEIIWKLLDEADIVVGQNSNRFDLKKLNARFILNGMQPPSDYKKIDTKLLATKHFAFTSNKLEYLSDKLNKKYKKLKHEKFPGFLLWKECLLGNKQAWNQMKSYNIHDVLALEELYNQLIPWDSTINFSVYHEDKDMVCSCGSQKFAKNGVRFTTTGKFQRYRCIECGAHQQGRTNLLSKEKRESLRK